MHSVCICDERKLLLRRNYFNYFTILVIYYYQPYTYTSIYHYYWNLYGFFVSIIGNLVNYIDIYIFISKYHL